MLLYAQQGKFGRGFELYGLPSPESLSPDHQLMFFVADGQNFSL